ncbi:MAG: alpha/beta fold hydrolase [Candidatus Thorarchaeota archaeon]
MKLRTRYIVLVLSIIIMLSGTGLAGVTQTGFGTVSVTEVDFQAADDSNIHATLQVPVYATDTDPLPGVVVIHGVLQCKEWLMAFGIELARRGFVTLTIDANGHGNSDAGSGSGTAALEYLADLDYVNSSSIGLIGHSMGGGISWAAIEESSVIVDALVLVGAWVSSSASYVPNLLVATGSFDSLFSYPRNLTLLEPSFGFTDIEAGVTYGNFEDGTARRAVFPMTNHLFETIDAVIVSESVEWMKNSLKGGEEDSYWIPSTDLIFPIWLVGGFISILGVTLSIFPLLVILMGLPIFQDIKKKPSTESAASNKTLMGTGAVYALIGLGAFFPLLGVGLLLDFTIPFPQRYGLGIISWILGSGLIAFVLLHLILHFRPGLALESSDETETSSILANRLMKTFLLALIATLWVYGWTLLVDIGFALDFRCFLPGFNDLTGSRALLVPIYFAACLVYFVVESKWLNGVMRTKTEGTWDRTQIDWTLKAILIKSGPYFILLIMQYGFGLITGLPLLPGMIGFSFLFFYAFAPWFVITTIFIVWGHHLTGHHYLGPMVNAFLFSWVLAAMLTMTI